MKQFSVKTQAAFYATIPAGVETTVVVDEKGVMYVPVFSLPNDLFTKGAGTTASTPQAQASSSTPAKGKKASAPAPEPEPEVEEEEADGGITIGSKVWANYPGDGTPYEATIVEVFPETEEVEVEWTDGGERSTIAITEISSMDEEAEEEVEEEEVEEESSFVTADEYADRLQKGLRVNVEWNDGEEGTESAWYLGTVTKVSPKGVVYVTYDEDGTEVALDASQHPQLELVAEE